MRPTGRQCVLSAGDEETSALLETLLGFEHIAVTAAHTVTEAKELAAIQDFDVHILGTRFPDGDGFELCRELKRISPLVPSIFYTGDMLPKDRSRGLACGADAYLVKPYQGDMVAIVRELIEEGHERRAAHIHLHPTERRTMRRSAGII